MAFLTDYILNRVDDNEIDHALNLGRWSVTHPQPSKRAMIAEAEAAYAAIREAHGFGRRAAPLLTDPTSNLKLEKGLVPSYGLTLQHHRSKLHGLAVNTCRWAGHCTKVCVLDNGNGRYGKVQRARDAKTEFLARHPLYFVTLLGREIALAVRKHGHILLRPNVNSDLSWEMLAPQLCDGHIFGDAVKLYGYTKNPDVLATDGWLGKAYRVAYSWNEHSEANAVRPFLARGGSVAVVTNRKPKQPIDQWGPIGTTVLDADLTDEWIFQSGVIGDLSAKGEARKLIGKSGFVVEVYR